jgi:hypothetical protein
MSDVITKNASGHVTGILSPNGKLLKFANNIPADPAIVTQSITDAAGMPVFDIGDNFTYNGTPVSRVDNGVGSRYTAKGARLLSTPVGTGTTDPTNFGWQTIGRTVIPGGALVGNASAVVTFTLDCPEMFGSGDGMILINIDSLSEGNIGTWYARPAPNEKSTTRTFTLTGKDSGTLTWSGGVWWPFSGYNHKRANLLKDIIVLFRYSSANGFGRSVTLRNAVIEIKDPVVGPVAGVPYRDPVQQPFKSNRFWNTPLGDGCTYQQATDPETANILTGNPGGVSNGAFAWISGHNGGANNFVQLKSDDPVVNFVYGSRAYSAPWPFAHKEANGVNSFRMRAPAEEFITAQSTDRVITLITPDKRYMIESGEYSYNATTKTHRLGYCTIWDLYGNGLSNNIAPGQPLLSDGYRASGHPLCGGIIRVSDLNSGSIDHVVAMQLSQWQQRAGVVSVANTPAGGSTFSVKPLDSQQKAQDYSALFKVGELVGFAGNNYTIATAPTYDAATNTTSFTVTVAITGTSGQLYVGGTNKLNQQLKQHLWPATCVDGYSLEYGIWSCYRGLVPLGAMFGIPPDVDVTKLGLTPEGVMLARAFQKYGGVNNDTTNNTLSVCFLESGMSQTQRDNLNKDRILLRNQLRMITNITAANPGGPGNRVATPPLDIYPLY